MMNIREYVEQADNAHAELYRNQSVAEVLLKKIPPHIPDWNKVMRQGGYFHVVPKLRPMTWTSMHDWIYANIGAEHYSWNGENFWFETEKDATWFALYWA